MITCHDKSHNFKLRLRELLGSLGVEGKIGDEWWVLLNGRPNICNGNDERRINTNVWILNVDHRMAVIRLVDCQTANQIPPLNVFTSGFKF